MNQRKLTLLGAAVLGAMLSMSAGAQDRNMSGRMESGDRGVITPSSAPETTGAEGVSGQGTARIPSLNSPSSSPESNPSDAGRQNQSPLVRDSRLRPSPIVPSGSSESNPSASMNDRTNDGGMGYGYGYRGRYGVGGTR